MDTWLALQAVEEEQPISRTETHFSLHSKFHSKHLNLTASLPLKSISILSLSGSNTNALIQDKFLFKVFLALKTSIGHLSGPLGTYTLPFKTVSILAL